MSQLLPVGIDFGNIKTKISAFVINNEDIAKSNVEIISDRNGSKSPSYFSFNSVNGSSQLFFSNGNRYSATAASLRVCSSILIFNMHRVEMIPSPVSSLLNLL